MNIDEISWKSPWRPLQFDAEIPGVQNQLEREITNKHILWNKEATAIGRRIDCDDVLVKLNDGSFAIVHLVWSSGPGDETYPSTITYDSLQELLVQMQEDALEYGEG